MLQTSKLSIALNAPIRALSYTNDISSVISNRLIPMHNTTFVLLYGSHCLATSFNCLAFGRAYGSFRNITRNFIVYTKYNSLFIANANS